MSLRPWRSQIAGVRLKPSVPFSPLGWIQEHVRAPARFPDSCLPRPYWSSWALVRSVQGSSAANLAAASSVLVDGLLTVWLPPAGLVGTGLPAEVFEHPATPNNTIASDATKTRPLVGMAVTGATGAFAARRGCRIRRSASWLLDTPKSCR